MKTIVNLLLRTVAASLCIVSYGQTPYPASLWSHDMAGNSSMYQPAQFKSIAYPKVDANSTTDFCYSDLDGIICEGSNGKPSNGASCNGLSLPGPGCFIPNFPDKAHPTDKHWMLHYFNTTWPTVQYGDLTGDGTADVCGLHPDGSGLYCATSTGSNFKQSPDIWPDSDFAAQNSMQTNWLSDPKYWRTIRLVDIDKDGQADICGRAVGGIYCATSTGAQFGSMSLRSSQFSDALGWGSDPSYWSTIQFADVNGDGWVDVCGRSPAGIICAFNDQKRLKGYVQFINPVLTTNQFSDQSTDQSNKPLWKKPEYYSTIHFADINGDKAADVCGRGPAGFYCGLAPVNQFIRTGTWPFVGAESIAAPEFSDQNGWNTDAHYKCLWLIENWDGQEHAAICGRGNDGIYCAKSTSTKGSVFTTERVSFDPAILYVYSFGDINGWNTSASYYETVQPAHPIAPISPAVVTRVGFCGRGDLGIYCSN
jgi:hypothetical protein